MQKQWALKLDRTRLEGLTLGSRAVVTVSTDSRWRPVSFQILRREITLRLTRRYRKSVLNRHNRSTLTG